MTIVKYVGRSVETTLIEALTDSPVVILNGPRQSGKSTLLSHLAGSRPSTALITLDASAERAAAHDDPEGYVLAIHDRLDADTVAIDEVQLVPGLFRAVKYAVDRDRKPGRFILAGSTRLLALPALSDSLAGRMEVVELWPLTQGELAGRRDGFLAAVLRGDLAMQPGGEARGRTIDRAVTGGFPPVIQRAPGRRRRWFTNYVASVIERDIAVLASLERVGQIPRIVSLIAARTGGLINMAEIARDSGVPVRTLASYLTWLERVFLIHRLPGWSSNRTSRAVKAPKIHLVDSGVLGSYLGVHANTVDNAEIGQLLETFVVGELRRQLAWSDETVELFHFRSPDGIEIDVVAEDSRGRLVGIEVKSSVGIDGRAFRGLRHLQQRHPDRFVGGIVLYCGTATLPFGPDLKAMPISSLWTA